MQANYNARAADGNVLALNQCAIALNDYVLTRYDNAMAADHTTIAVDDNVTVVIANTMQSNTMLLYII